MIIPNVGDRYHFHDYPGSKSKLHLRVVGVNEETKYIQFSSEEVKPQRYQRTIEDFNQALKTKMVSVAKCKSKHSVKL